MGGGRVALCRLQDSIFEGQAESSKIVRSELGVETVEGLYIGVNPSKPGFFRIDTEPCCDVRGIVTIVGEVIDKSKLKDIVCNNGEKKVLEKISYLEPNSE